MEKRTAKLMNVMVGKMCVRAGVSQRQFNRSWAIEIAKDFDIEDFGAPTVNRVGDWWWVVDGQHRIEAFKLWIGDGWETQKVECWVYHDLDEKGEANLFDRLNTVKGVHAYDRFVVRLTAERETETNIAAIVRLKKLKIGRNRGENTMTCVAALERVYHRGAEFLARDLSIVNSAFGDSGLDADIISGIGEMVARYDGQMDDKRAQAAFGNIRGGTNALRTRASKIQDNYGGSKVACIAAAGVEIYNRQVSGKARLANWWKE